jgi:carbonic anhydrase
MTKLPLAFFVSLTFASLPSFASAFAAASSHGADNVDGPAALAKLLEGNRRYVNTEVAAAQPLARQRAQSATTQHPFAIVVACADSRVAPELVFDQGLGALFVIRTAGNLVEDFALGSIEYAVEHLGVRLVLVLGHERCGAVGAALAAAPATGHVRALVAAIAPAVVNSRASADPIDACVVANTRAVAEKIRHSQPALSELAHGEVSIVSARYDLDTGLVTLLE